KRAVLRPVIEGLKRLGSYSVAEVDSHDSWQRAGLGVAVVAPDGASLAMQISKLRRYLDSCPEIQVAAVEVTELEEPECVIGCCGSTRSSARSSPRRSNGSPTSGSSS